ncbi:MAG: hypothetical protein SXV54_18115 [Chloroflexota bacterium]|nr:hypothetical protein [Chloroflexota bacterium]
MRKALQDVVPDAEMLGRLGVRYVAAAFPILSEGLSLEGEMDGVWVYENHLARPLAGSADAVALSGGQELFRVQPWPVYAGWALSGVTVAGLLTRWLVGWLWRRRADA